jgi:hypothetical protein
MRTIAIVASVTVALTTSPAPLRAATGKAAPAAATAIHLVFKLDPRLAGGSYGGERWVSPQVFQGAVGQGEVDVKASAVDAGRRPIKVGIQWSPSDPELVSVTPSSGERVRIAVKRAGKSTLTVKSGETSRKLTVDAAGSSGSWQVTISQ